MTSHDEEWIGPLETIVGDAVEELDQALAGILYVDPAAEARL